MKTLILALTFIQFTIFAQDGIKIETASFDGKEFRTESIKNIDGNSIAFGLSEDEKYLIGEEYNDQKEMVSNVEYEILEVYDEDIFVRFKARTDINEKPTELYVIFFKDKNLIEFEINGVYYFYTGNVAY